MHLTQPPPQLPLTQSFFITACGTRRLCGLNGTRTKVVQLFCTVLICIALYRGCCWVCARRCFAGAARILAVALQVKYRVLWVRTVRLGVHRTRGAFFFAVACDGRGGGSGCAYTHCCSSILNMHDHNKRVDKWTCSRELVGRG